MWLFQQLFPAKPNPSAAQTALRNSLKSLMFSQTSPVLGRFQVEIPANGFWPMNAYDQREWDLFKAKINSRTDRTKLGPNGELINVKEGFTYGGFEVKAGFDERRGWFLTIGLPQREQRDGQAPVSDEFHQSSWLARSIHEMAWLTRLAPAAAFNTQPQQFDAYDFETEQVNQMVALNYVRFGVLFVNSDMYLVRLPEARRFS